MFGFWKKAKVKKTPDIGDVLKRVVRNEITITTRETQSNGAIVRSKLGGKPAVPAGFEWPRFEAENYDGVTANRPLSFLCQINLKEIAPFDREKMLPQKGLLLFFYEQETMCWGFDPEDSGCSRVIYIEDIEKAELMDFPDDLEKEYRVKEYDISFDAKDSYPDFEELDFHTDIACDAEAYDEMREGVHYEMDDERHKMLGYANLIQGEMLSDCERIARGLFCGDARSYQNTPDAAEAEIRKSASEWILLFQLASIRDDDYELMFGDLGNLYFYIREDALKAKRFNEVWLVSQCG